MFEQSATRATLKDYVKNGNKSVETLVSGKMGRKPVLPVELEEQHIHFHRPRRRQAKNG